MEYLQVKGGASLHGTLLSPRSKNAALPILAASLLAEKAYIKAVPRLGDVATMCSLLDHLGTLVEHEIDNEQINITCHHDNSAYTEIVAPYDLVRKMRASVLVMGPLLARYGKASISLPGGCAIGARPVDIHLSAFEQMGVKVYIEDGYIHANAPNGLVGAQIHLPFPSVGATENIMTAAVLAQGETVIHQAAREPEIINLGHFLQSMGAEITGLGDDVIRIKPVSSSITEAHVTIMEDRIQVGSYIIASMTTGGELLVPNGANIYLDTLYDYLEQSGVTIKKQGADYQFIAPNIIKPLTIITEPYPGFPTDLQAQMAAFLCYSNGKSVIYEKIFENRFMHVPELMRMGANIIVKNSIAEIHGVETLKGADVMATDLRASMGLVIAALRADNISKIHRLYHLDRGYENLEQILSNLGAQIERRT